MTPAEIVETLRELGNEWDVDATTAEQLEAAARIVERWGDARALAQARQLRCHNPHTCNYSECSYARRVLEVPDGE